MGDGASAVTAPHPRIEAASLEESHQSVVIREPQAADAKRHLIARRRPSGGGDAGKGRGELSGGGSAGTRASGRRGEALPEGAAPGGGGGPDSGGKRDHPAPGNSR